MSKTLKAWLLVGFVAVAAWLAYGSYVINQATDDTAPTDGSTTDQNIDGTTQNQADDSAGLADEGGD